VTGRARRAALAALLVAAAVLPVGACSSGGGEGDCAWALRYQGRRYVLAVVHKDSVVVRHRGARLGSGTLLGCADGPTDDQRVTVYRVPGVSPRLAVTVSGDPVVGVVDPHHLPAAVRKLADEQARGDSPDPGGSGTAK
jgi:hypothetical protein